MSYSQNLSDLLIKPDEYYTQTRPEMIGYIPNDCKQILDVGCGSGLFGGQLKQKLNSGVWGIELDNDAAIVAKEKIDKVLVGDIFHLIDDLPNAFFDCIVFNDVLEHLADPFAVLLKIKSKLTTNGVIVCSIPNVRYFFTLKDLLVKKQWKYEDAGILDKTHLRFFTQRSIIDMFNSLGYKIIKMEGINAINSWKFILLNIVFLGYLSDTRYLQFACVVKPK